MLLYVYLYSLSFGLLTTYLFNDVLANFFFLVLLSNSGVLLSTPVNIVFTLDMSVKINYIYISISSILLGSKNGWTRDTSARSRSREGGAYGALTCSGREGEPLGKHCTRVSIPMRSKWWGARLQKHRASKVYEVSNLPQIRTRAARLECVCVHACVCMRTYLCVRAYVCIWNGKNNQSANYILIICFNCVSFLTMQPSTCNMRIIYLLLLLFVLWFFNLFVLYFFAPSLVPYV